MVNHKPVVHIVDSETGFRNGTFVTNKSSENLWNDLVNCWASVYAGSLRIFESIQKLVLHQANSVEMLKI